MLPWSEGATQQSVDCESLTLTQGATQQSMATVAVCDECKEHYCTECIDTHTCGTNVICSVQYI